MKSLVTSDQGGTSHYARYAPPSYQSDDAKAPNYYLNGIWLDQVALPQEDNENIVTLSATDANGVAEFRKIDPKAPGEAVEYVVSEMLPSHPGPSLARIGSDKILRFFVDGSSFKVSTDAAAQDKWSVALAASSDPERIVLMSVIAAYEVLPPPAFAPSSV